jgi:zinc protease
VTAEQVRAVARKYLVDENLTVATLVPQAIEHTGSTASTVAAGGRHGS